MLWTDVVTPLELTATARLSAEERERSRASLSEFLPNRPVADIAVRLTETGSGLVEAAEYRAYDAETAIGAAAGGKRVTLDLPPVGQKVRVSELDQLRIRGALGEAAMRQSIGETAVRVGRAVADRVELLRGQVLATGKATINENQFFAEADFGRSEDLNITVGTGWQNAGDATPLDDLTAAVQKYTDINGEAPGTLLLSRRAMNALIRSDEIRGTAVGGVSTLVTRDYVVSLFEAHGLPTPQVYDRVVRQNGKAVRVLDEELALLLPENVPGESALGSTFWGTTLESTDPKYGIVEQDRPGIVAGAYTDDDPMGVWVKASAIGMPVLANADLTAALTVIK